MKKIIFSISFALCSLFCSGQELEGVWLNYNDRILDEFEAHTTGDEGFLIDFNNSIMGHIKSDTLIKIRVKTKENIVKIKVPGIRGQQKFRIYEQDSLETDSGENKIRVFHKLDLLYKIEMSEKEITEYLISNNFDSIQGIKGHFSSDQFFRDKIFEKPHRRNQFENKNWEDAGYWFIKKIDGNAFLIFTIGQMERMNILQIKSITEKGLQVNHLQDDEYMRNLIEIKTCLQQRL